MDDSERQSGDARDPRRGGGPDLEGRAEALGMPKARHEARDRRGPATMSGRDSRDVREATGRDARREAAPKLKVMEAQGQARRAGPGTGLKPATLRLEDSGLTLEVGTGRPIRAGYRDLSVIAIQQTTAMIALGEGPDAMRWMLEQFGARLGPLVRELRERRLKQRLADGLVEVPDGQAELVEFAWQPSTAGLGPGPDGPAAPASGVGQLVQYPWGFVVAPVDERVSWIRYRRASISEVTLPFPGDVEVYGAPGRLTLKGLGAAATRYRDNLTKLRDGAFADAAGFVEQLLPDAPFGLRQKASGSLVDGRPVRPDEFGASWPVVEAAVLGEPDFAASYQSLSSAAGKAAPRWVAMAPVEPGAGEPKIWFLIALPGNLVALELVSAGAHATYFFRVKPRPEYRGEPPERLGLDAERAVREISEALIDCRFLREPMALPDDQLRLPRYLRYRLALAVLPTLAAARARFVARIAHTDPVRWSAAVTDLMRWHGSARDEAAEWPKRAAQEAEIAEAGGEGGEGETDAATGEPAASQEVETPDKAAPGRARGEAGSGTRSEPSGTTG
jgi:hypothetical protein